MSGRTNGEAVYTLTSYDDKINGLAREKTELQRVKRALEAILAINRLLQRETDELSLLKDTCKLIVGTAKYRLAWIGFCCVTNSNEKVVTPVASYGYDWGYTETAKITWDDSERAKGPTGAALKTAKPSVCRYILTDEKYEPWKDEALRRGYKSSIAIPIILEEQVIGTVNIYATEPDAFDNEEISLLSELSNDLSMGISTIRMRAKNKDYENKLLEMNKNLERLVEQEIKKRQQQEQLLVQQSKMAAMGEMLSIISHQWKQPLNWLSLAVQEIKDAHKHDELTEKIINDTVNNSMRYIRFMSTTVDDFRNFLIPSKLKIEFSVRKAAEEILHMFSELFSRDNIKITLSEDDSSDAYFAFGYPNEFKQVVLNIINNSRDAILTMRKSGLMDRDVCGMITLRLMKEDGKVIVTIADNGGGIGEDIADKIFEHYFTTKSDMDGTGIGLYMSKTIIEDSMGGSLTFKNIEGGAEFKIVI